MSANRNYPEQQREQDGVEYFERDIRQVGENHYRRLAVHTHFVERGEDLHELLRRYAAPVYLPGDILAIGEKVVSMCQDNTVQMSDVKLGFWAKLLSKFATSNSHGVGMDEPYKLQLAINLKGLPRILWASIAGGICRIFGKRGVFYKIAGPDIAGLDGFYKGSDFEIYHTLAVLTPREPDKLCAEIENQLGMTCFLSDANDFDVTIMGCSPALMETPSQQLVDIMKDNPAGQGTELTPFVIIRACEPQSEADACPQEDSCDNPEEIPYEQQPAAGRD